MFPTNACPICGLSRPHCPHSRLKGRGRRRMTLWYVIILTLGLLAVLIGFANAQICGIPPIPPIPSIGCKEMVPVCVCLQNGTCFWTFQCVPA